MDYHLAPSNWQPDAPNPFREDGSYSPGTTAIVVAEDTSPFIGCSKAGLFYYRFERKTPHIEAIIVDLLGYELSQGRTLIVHFPDNGDTAAYVHHALAVTPPPHVVRDSDPRYLVHSTELQSGRQIIQDGAIKSLSRLTSEGHPPTWQKLRSSILGEPPEYANHINFGPFDSPQPEIVVASHSLGRFASQDDTYSPGVRFYFDAHQIIRQGLAIRVADGIKVLGEIPLEPFCLFQVNACDLASDRDTPIWTPDSFTRKANAAFRNS